MQQNIQDLRSKLFKVMDDLQAGTIDVPKAKALNETAQVLVNTAKVEISFMRLNGSLGSGFIPVTKGKNPQLKEGNDSRGKSKKVA